jgi:glucosamine kinase
MCTFDTKTFISDLFTMILIIDSGSTKSDWVLLNEQERTYFSTIGLNPYFHSSDLVYQTVCENEGLYALKDQISAVYFYGAGCSSTELNKVIENGLKRVFQQATVMVDHDLKACAFATYQGEPSISCIIGTGSNSCYFDGKEIYEEVPALGYILGDEGSGTYFGKKLLSNYLYKLLPKHIHQAIQDQLGLTKDEIVENVYMKPDANVYLASFMKFIIQFAEDSYVKAMILEGFKHFIQIHVACYENHKQIKVHFVGSIAHLFRAELEEACNFHNVQLGQTIQKPIEGLINYHIQYILKNHTNAI